jgi:CO/xanthine dehydrogenase FAD-binding subunit
MCATRGNLTVRTGRCHGPSTGVPGKATGLSAIRGAAYRQMRHGSTMYLRLNRLEEALEALQRTKGRLLAGGTDIFPSAVERPVSDRLIDISGISALRGIRVDGDTVRIGACTTWSEIARAPLPHAFDGLKAAAREVGGVQIQNTGTIGGNLCNASPAADGVPPLLALDAEVVLASTSGLRRLALSEFILGNRKTALRPGEILTEVSVPCCLGARARSEFLKLGSRCYLVISIAMVAVVLEPDAHGYVRFARLAVGACSPVAVRLPELEEALICKPFGAGLGAYVNERHLASLRPIDDVRASAAYRREAALILVRRALERCGAGADKLPTTGAEARP